MSKCLTIVTRILLSQKKSISLRLVISLLFFSALLGGAPTSAPAAEMCSDLFREFSPQKEVDWDFAEEFGRYIDAGRISGLREYPRDRYRSASDWSDSICRRLSRAANGTVEYLAQKHSDLLPLKEEDLRHQYDQKVMWAFRFRRLDLIKKYIEWANRGKLGYDGNILYYLNQMNGLSEGQLKAVLSPLYHGYENLTKGEQRSSSLVATKRVADAVVSKVAETGMTLKSQNPIEIYQEYLSRVGSLVAPKVQSSDSKMASVSRDAKQLVTMFDGLSRQLREEVNRTGVQSSLILFGSSVNGRAKLDSDIDFAFFEVKKDGSTMRAPVSFGQRLLETARTTYGPQIVVSDMTFEFPSATAAIELGLKLNAVVIEIRSDGVYMILRKRMPSLTNNESEFIRYDLSDSGFR